MASIREKAVLVSLSISCWVNSARDSSVIDKLVKDTGADSDVHNYLKILVKPEMLKPVKVAEYDLRRYYLNATLPWSGNGTRILPSAKLMDFTVGAREKEAAYEHAVAAFCRGYPQMKAEAKRRLHKLYNEEDFPTAAAIKRKFGYRIYFDPVPDKEDFRVNLSADEVKMLKQSVEATTRDSTRTAMIGLVERVQKHVALLSQRLKEDDRTLRSALVGNLREMVSDLDVYNLVSDPKIVDIQKALDAAIKDVDIEALRDDPKARKTVATKADAVLAKMAGYIGGGAA